MAKPTKHDVKFSIPERKLGVNDVEFKVRRYGKPLGRLLVSKGGLEWVTSGKKNGKRATWRQMLAFFDPPKSHPAATRKTTKQVRSGIAQEKVSDERPVPSLYEDGELTVERF